MRAALAWRRSPAGAAARVAGQAAAAAARPGWSRLAPAAHARASAPSGHCRRWLVDRGLGPWAGWTGAARHLAAASQPPRDHYATLGVQRSATQAEVKRAYLAKAKKCHPDLHKNDPDATRRFQELANAYQVLGDVGSRAAYDMNPGAQNSGFGAGSGAGSGQPPPPGQPPRHEPVDPFELFRSVLEELGAEQLLNRLEAVQREAGAAARSAQAGDLQPARDFAWRHKALAAVVVLPALMVFRFPWLVGMALRGLALVAAMVLQSPQLRHFVGQAVWYHWRILIRRAEARARSKR